MKRYILLLLTLCCCTASFAQYTNTFYFMDEISTRNQMNPAFLPRCKSYFDFILLPNISLNVGENALSFNDLFYRKDNRTSNILASQATVDDFLDNLSRHPYAKANFNLNILNFGTQIKPNHYLIFDFNLRSEVTGYIPKDLFRFAIKGTPDPYLNHFDLSDLDLETNAYATAGIGYSGRLHKKVTFGAKAKFLLGFMNTTTDIDRLDLNASSTQWNVASRSTINIATPVPINYRHTNGDTVDFNSFSLGDFNKFHPAGYGASFDLGITYEPIEHLVISAAVTDLGFITWEGGYNYEAALNGDYQYNGLFGTINFNDSISSNNISEQLEQLGDSIKNDVRIKDRSGYTAMITGRFNAGIEYGVLNNKISFGIMNQLSFNRKRIYDELTLAVNFRPCQWFKASLSYSFLNRNWGSLGVGINLNLGGFSWYIISDYVPVTYTEATYRQDGATKSIVVPDRVRFFNLQTGVLFNLHRFERDLDNDGVRNSRDDCPDTDMDFLRTKCPGLKNKQLVDKHGCDRDGDKDGVNDCFDQCPDTPEGVKVDSVGCPLDTDHDGVPDSYDHCPDTPEGVSVDSYGCPLDEDADGVPDYLDKCPNTPQNVVVDSEGCPVDSDNDGIPDYLDRCPDTPAGIAVDAKGCPLDGDGDGVPDYIDQCPETPLNVAVDSVGCPVDSDGDSVPDYLDKCPDRPGTAGNNGCPELTEVKEVFRKAMHGIQFETGKSTIKKASYPILDQIVALMSIDTTYSLEISGHTDNVGKPENNLRLSEERASSVRKYLIQHGISEHRITSAGYGDTQPVADNKTKKGREQNRRVEFNIVYEKISYQE